MSETRVINNVLYAMAQTMSSREDYPTAVALRKLARAGYSSLEQVDTTSDWTLLSIPGIGVGRLAAVRRLTRSDWRPPSLQAVKAISQFGSATKLALRFWPQQTLAAVIEGPGSEVTVHPSQESSWAIHLYTRAVEESLLHWPCEELIGLLDAEVRAHGQAES